MWSPETVEAQFLNTFYFRDLETVLKEDKQKLKQMQKLQPKFTEEQKRELIEVHPWIQQGGLPKTVANSVSLNEWVTFACITVLKLLAAYVRLFHSCCYESLVNYTEKKLNWNFHAAVSGLILFIISLLSNEKVLVSTV